MSPSSFFFLILAFMFFVFSAVILIVFRKNKTALYISLLLPQLALCSIAIYIFTHIFYEGYFALPPLSVYLLLGMCLILPIVFFVKYRAAKKAADAQPPADDAE